MKPFFIFIAIALLASCQKERNQSTVIQTSRPDTSGAITKTPPLDTSAPLAPDSAIIPIGSAALQFNISNIEYRFNENIIAKEYTLYGLKHIFIEVQKDPSTYRINIMGTSTEISPGTYRYGVGQTTFIPNSAMFVQWQYDYGILERDFSLQVLSYQEGYLDATFYSSRVSNGIINHLKIEQ